MKTVVGAGYYLRTLNARVVNIVCDWQRRQKKAPSHSPLKKPLRATPSHCEVTALRLVRSGHIATVCSLSSPVRCCIGTSGTIKVVICWLGKPRMRSWTFSTTDSSGLSAPLFFWGTTFRDDATLEYHINVCAPNSKNMQCEHTGCNKQQCHGNTQARPTSVLTSLLAHHSETAHPSPKKLLLMNVGRGKFKTCSAIRSWWCS